MNFWFLRDTNTGDLGGSHGLLEPPSHLTLDIVTATPRLHYCFLKHTLSTFFMLKNVDMLCAWFLETYTNIFSRRPGWACVTAQY